MVASLVAIGLCLGLRYQADHKGACRVALRTFEMGDSLKENWQEYT